MKKILILLIIPFLLTGCFDYNELNNIAIISGVAIDYHDDLYKVTFEIISTKKSGDSSASTSSYTVSSEGKTITDAFLTNGNKMDKVPYYDHIEIVVISEEIAKKHLEEVSEYLIRSPKFRNEIYMAIAKDVSAQKLISTNSKEKPITSTYLVQLLENSHDADSAGYYAPFTEVLNNIITDGEDAIMSAFTVKNDKVVLDGMGLFQNYKLKTIVNLDRAPTINLLNNFNTQNILYETSCTQNKNIVISIYDGDVKFVPSSDKIKVEAKLMGRIHEDKCSASLRDTNTYKEIEKEFSKIIASKMNEVINILKLNKTNTLKIGLYEHIKYRNASYYNWLNKPFEYDVTLKLNKKGLIFEVE